MIYEDDEDKSRFLNILKRCKEISNYQLYAYCLMDNHVHLLVRETADPIGNVIKRISSSYVYYYNSKYERCGHLFQERYKSESVETKRYFLTVLRYIHQNPVKAGLVGGVFESNWTSVFEYIHNTDIVDIEFALTLFSSERESAVPQFIEFMKARNDDECLEYEEMKRMLDSEVKELMQKMGIPTLSVLQQMDREMRDAILFQLKGMKGVSIRQLSRITGISRSVIQRAKRDCGTQYLSL